MNRLKVLVFALIALGLWAASLTMATPALATRAADQASLQVLGAPAAFAQQLEVSRSAVQAAVLRVAASPAGWLKPAAKVEAPTADRLNAVRAVAHEAFAEAERASLIVGLYNDAGALMAQGTGEPAAPPDSFDAKGIAGALSQGQLVDVNGVRYIFFATVLVSAAQGEPKPAGAAFVGAPVGDLQKLADTVAKEFHLAGFGVWADGKLAAFGGAKKEQLEAWFKASKPGQAVPVESGSLVALGPVHLPLFTGSPNPPLEIGARRDIPGTPFEVLAVASARPFMQALADGQKMSLFMFVGLLVAALAFTLLVTNGSSTEEDDDEQPAAAVAKPAVPEPALLKKDLSGGAALPLADAPAPKEASPDDFQFGPPPTAPTPEPAAPSAPPPADPFDAIAPASKAAAPSSLGDYDEQRTTAYPAHRPAPPPVDEPTNVGALDPFAMAGGGAPVPNNPFGSDFNPDATKVATIPPELLNASRGQVTSETTRLTPAAPLPKVQPIAPMAHASGEEQHFQETFRDFVATREKCGEAGDGLTYEKFAAKLRKNKEQLVAKYNCKTVRFQVYVKDGKAALKATPVKD